MRSGRKKAENESPSKVRPGRMRILPGLAYNDMKRILPGFFSMAGKSTPAAGRLLFDGREEYPGCWPASFRWQGRVPRPLAGYSSMAGKNAWSLPGFFLAGLSDV